MCGIVGVFNNSDPSRALAVVERMNDTIVHRGPDDAGTWAGRGAAIGMRRLSIIDLVGGRQPMATDDGVHIVFNGEIYNYRRLRAELEREGYRFRTHSDTEVILNLYHRGGVEAIEQLEGMFAICLVDTRSGIAHLFRDRMGIKPLYYGEHHGRFYFASELKAILEVLPTRPAVNERSLYDYLTLRYVPGPESVWEGLRKLAPGYRLSYDLARHQWTEVPYWRLDFAADPFTPDRDYEQEFHDLFLQSVESHLLTADVPVGTLLSGGLDSSAVSAAAAELGIRGLHTFSVSFADGGEFSELSYAREVASHIGAEHHEIVIGQREFVDFLPEFVRYTDEPLADLASIPLYYVSRLAREHVKVVMSGEGADEVLAGYGFEESGRDAAQRRWQLGWIPRGLFRVAAPLFGGQRGLTLRTMGRDGWSGYVKAWAPSATCYWEEGEKAKLWGKSAPVSRTEDRIRGWYDGCRSREPLDLLQHAYCQDWLVEDLLMKADKMTMANSIELRVPYLTHSLVRWAQRLPVVWRVGDRRHGYVSKRILRAFAAKRLPASIISRPKQGFPVPAYHWLSDRLGDWAAARLLPQGRSPLDDWLNREPIAQQLSAARAGNLDSAHRIWGLLVLREWADIWL